MAEFVNLDINLRSVQKNIDDLPKISKSATAATLNKAGRKANTTARKFITSNYNIKARSLKLGGLVSLRRADARKPNPTFTIFIRKVGRGLMKYGANTAFTKKSIKAGGKGVNVKVKKSVKNISQAFISSWRKGGVQQQQFVFRKATGKNAGRITRVSKRGTPYMADKRESLYGPSVAQLYNSRRVRAIINKSIVDNYQPMFDADFKKRLDRRKK